MKTFVLFAIGFGAVPFLLGWIEWAIACLQMLVEYGRGRRKRRYLNLSGPGGPGYILMEGWDEGEEKNVAVAVEHEDGELDLERRVARTEMFFGKQFQAAAAFRISSHWRRTDVSPLSVSD